MINSIKRNLPNIAGAMLGLTFIASSIVVLFNLVDMPAPPEETPMFHFMTAFGSTGYMKFIKVLELFGGILVAIPFLRNFGLLILGPIIINILAFHIFITSGEGLFSPMIIFLVIVSIYLLFHERRKFLGLIKK
jgi:putative oxidoreductase